jgi:hypothetical protein
MTDKKYIIDDRGTFKGGLITMSVVTLIGAGLFVWSSINYDEYSEITKSLKTGIVARRGLAPTIYGWTMFGVPLFTLGILFMIMSKDFKVEGLIIDDNGVLLNREGVKKTLIKYDNIKKSEIYIDDSPEVENKTPQLLITIIDPTVIVKNQIFPLTVMAKKKFVDKKEPINISATDLPDNDIYEINDFIQGKLA